MESNVRTYRGGLVNYENGRRMELAYIRVQWRVLMLAILNPRVLLPEYVSLIGYLLMLRRRVLLADGLS